MRLILTIITIGVLVGVMVPPRVLADTMSSTNFTVEADVISIGGNRSTSSNYVAEDTLGDLATGENLTSSNFRACAGYQCFLQEPFITMSVREGTSAPGVAGAGVSLGTLTVSQVATSNDISANSIFITAETNAGNGVAVTVRDENNGLKRASTLDTILSTSTTLVAGTAGYGICVRTATESGSSPTSFVGVAPFNGDCDKISEHEVGAVATSPNDILTSAGPLLGGEAEVLVKAAISPTTAAGNDYTDVLTFIGTGTF